MPCCNEETCRDPPLPRLPSCPLVPMNPSFWPHFNAAAPATDKNNGQQPDDCNACPQCPVDDWLIPCSSPDCNLPSNAGCTEQCVVVTHVDAQCDDQCDAAAAAPCDNSCEGFDSNWVCDGDNCSVFGGQFVSPSRSAPAAATDSQGSQMPRPEDMKNLSHLQGFAHIVDPTPSFSPFFCPCASGDFSRCLDPSHCTMGTSMLTDNSHLIQQQQQQHHQPQQQQHHQPQPFPAFTSPIQIPSHIQHNSHSPSTGSAMTPSTASYHSSPSPMYMHQQSSANLQPDKECLWSDCHAVFPSTGDLFAHLSQIHIPGQELLQAPPVSVPTSCLWDDCNIFPNLSSIPGPSANPGPAAVTNFLTTHLLQDHLGLARPPQVHTPVLPTPASLSPAPSHSTRAGTVDPLSSEEESVHPTSAAPQIINVSPYNGPQTLAVSDPHAHACLWIGCNDVFPTCDALTAHIAAAHVGSGKAQYECQWRGCSRTGAQPFASKQKILRHMQVRAHLLIAFRS